MFGSDNGKLYVLSKFSGTVEWTYEPGYYIFNAAIITSPATYGNMTYFGSDDGYLYAVNIEKQFSETSIWAYYVGGILLIIVVVIIAARMLKNRFYKE